VIVLPEQARVMIAGIVRKPLNRASTLPAFRLTLQQKLWTVELIMMEDIYYSFA
jgi:hypothetical protein